MSRLATILPPAESPAETSAGEADELRRNFIDTCVETVLDSAKAVTSRSDSKPRVRQLLKVLAGKKKILIATHRHPDPDAIASALALCELLSDCLAGATVQVGIQGAILGGLNQVFAQQTLSRMEQWEKLDLASYDGIVLVDTQPQFANNPLPPELPITGVIDHHRTSRRRGSAAFRDVRSDVGATGSIIFSYYMELEHPISRDLAALLLFAIESDLAGGAGHPDELDNIALSTLTLMADTRKLYKMRYLDLPQSYYAIHAEGMLNAIYDQNIIVSHLSHIDSPEKPAIVADLLLRFDQAKWALVTAVHEKQLLISLRTSAGKTPTSAAPAASDVMAKLVREIGQGGGHRAKAGGLVQLETGDETEIKQIRDLLRKRLIRLLGAKGWRGKKLVPFSVNG